MAVKVELFMQVCINGRPIWRKAKSVRAELSTQMTDAEYDRVLSAGVMELDKQVRVFKEKVEKLDKVNSK